LIYLLCLQERWFTFSSYFFLFLSDCDETDVNIGIDMAMYYASKDPQSPFSNAHTPLCKMYFTLSFVLQLV
jgi:hypothetical protein